MNSSSITISISHEHLPLPLIVAQKWEFLLQYH